MVFYLQTTNNVSEVTGSLLQMGKLMFQLVVPLRSFLSLVTHVNKIGQQVSFGHCSIYFLSNVFRNCITRQYRNMGSVDVFVAKHLKLLQLEQEEEVKTSKEMLATLSLPALQRRGLCLIKLKIGSYKTGLYGRCICTFESHRQENALQSHNFTPGDIAGVFKSDDKCNVIASGVVNQVKATSIQVAFEGSFESLELSEDEAYSLVKLANDITYERMKIALNDLGRCDSSSVSLRLVRVLFGESAPGDPAVDSGSAIKFMNQHLNASQKEAVVFALSRPEVAVIHGPPGTGKTETVVEIILQAVLRGIKVLACAPSNVAVDNMAQRLVRNRARIVRLGHPARTSTSIQRHTLDAILARSDSNQVLDDMRKELDGIVARTRKTQNKAEEHRLRHERHLVAAELKRREKLALQHTLKMADVVLATLINSSSKGPIKNLPINHFGLIVIDECAQALEAACWIPLLKAPKCVLAGDHKQLPPTIISKKAAVDGLALSLMERVVDLYGSHVVRMLCVQYRMHNDIMLWPSKQLYDEKLVAHESVRQHLLKDIDGVEDNEDTSIPLLLIDTACSGFYELDLEDEDSKGNEGEADLVSIHVENLIMSGLKETDIAIITPYNLQVELLRLRLAAKYPALEIKSVDGFQGREKAAVVLSLVRSNKEGEVGFLSDDRRINVAITRAKCHLAVICDSETVSHHDFLKSLLEYITSSGEVRSCNQYNTELNDRDICRPEHLKFKSIKGKAKDAQESKKKIKKSSVPVKDASVRPHARDASENSDRAERMKELERQVHEFTIDDTVECLEFPSSLNSYERRLVHEIAEKLCLVHLSKGDDEARTITVYKKIPAEEPEAFSKTNASTAMVKTSNVDPSTPLTSATKSTSPKRQVTKKPKKSIQQVPTVKHNAEVEEDFDSLIAKATEENTKCAFQGCKTSILMLKQTCRHCSRTFCFSHSLPEVHGCGENAKTYARSQIRKVPPPSRRSDPTKRAQLQHKMDKKLAELSKQRKAKP